MSLSLIFDYLFPIILFVALVGGVGLFSLSYKARKTWLKDQGIDLDDEPDDSSSF